jgi:hypothetical protein
MLTLVFAEPGPAPVLRRGPFPEVRADGEFLRAPDEKVIARQQNPAWYVGPQKFFRIAYGDAEIYAHVDVDACLWYCHRDQRCWKEMVVVPAG